MYNDSNSPLCEEFGHESGSEYYDVTGLRFRVYKPTFVTTIGDRQSHLMTHVLEQNDGEPGECLWNAIRSQLKDRPNLTGITNEEFLRQTGMSPDGVKLTDLETIETEFAHKGRGKKAKEYKLSFVVFDGRMRLLRLPPHRETDKHM